VNRVIREIGPINSDAPAFPLAANAISAIRKQVEGGGSGDFTPLWCGQNSSGCKEISAAELTRELAADL
jgi:nitronate monooxygenase